MNHLKTDEIPMHPTTAIAVVQLKHRGTPAEAEASRLASGTRRCRHATRSHSRRLS
jgi:hypothetical protein